MIVSNLSSPYTASIDFAFSSGENGTSGKADITKADITTLTFKEPLSYSGISIKSDETGNEDILSFELSGIPASVPKTIAGDLSLMFSLFTDSLPKESFRLSGKVNDIGNELIEVFFTENGLNYTISYDRYSGIPYSVNAGNDEISVSVTLSEFTKINTQTKKDVK